MSALNDFNSSMSNCIAFTLAINVGSEAICEVRFFISNAMLSMSVGVETNLVPSYRVRNVGWEFLYSCRMDTSMHCDDLPASGIRLQLFQHMESQIIPDKQSIALHL
ncbi:unnamed protein product [Euphydryas editha]|uniref:Uncharacterized protein n=1 Tax=Euphydryas editha TaxID=104508 RepID=A0AAU9UDQ6_EUPED|nr:unnamed protein product [Euphydryas editha]